MFICLEKWRLGLNISLEHSFPKIKMRWELIRSQIEPSFRKKIYFCASQVAFLLNTALKMCLIYYEMQSICVRLRVYISVLFLSCNLSGLTLPVQRISKYKPPCKATYRHAS